MTRKRDSQRALVYAWQLSLNVNIHSATMTTVDEVAAFVGPIWKAERGRYGRARVAVPAVHCGHWGQRQALAYSGSHRISLPRWARNPWVILHELAHLLALGDMHGPRFVGVLIGLACRHLGYDAYALMAAADRAGVKYNIRSIGAVPLVTLWQKVAELLPATDMELAVELDVSYRQIHGAALCLIRAGRARWYRGKLVSL